ncbi:MAG: cache domain-containing protein [Clostridia bacterium]|nr:cache domain-containing protein [Clostridia bacterium]
MDKKLNNTSLRTRLIIFFAVMVLITNVFIGFFAFRSAKFQLTESTKVMLQNSTRVVLDLIENKNKDVIAGYITQEEAEESVKQFILGPMREDGTRPVNTNINLGKNGYIFIMDSQGIEVAHPCIEGQNAWHITDRIDKDFYISHAIIAKASEGGFTYYNWELPYSDEVSEKLVYGEFSNSWDWVICSSIYLDDFSEGAHMVLRLLLLSTIPMFVFAFLGILLFTNAALRPIRELAYAMENVNANNNILPDIKYSNDEIGLLSRTFVDMLDRLNHKRDMLIQARSELKDANNRLEALVEERTRKLEDSLEELLEAQQHLIESERLATLGNLVAGIIHEVNTPLGIGVTTVSHLNKLNTQALRQLSDNEMTAEDLKKFFLNVDESITILQHNLDRAAELINSFKQVAVNQTAIVATQFNVYDYFKKILLSLKHEYKRTHHEINIVCDEAILIYTYPGALSQILTNLIMNSLIHGFEGIDKGHIIIKFEVINDTYHLTYSDDGVGISKENLGKIFEPFFTTKRSSGGSGLGLHIIYTVATQQLGGTINIESDVNQGIEVLIRFPKMKRGGEDE